MKDLNVVFLMGNLTRDPELRYTPNGQAVTTFTVATNRRWNDAEGVTKDAVEYTDVVAWGKMAENMANFMKKGRRVHVTGRMQTRTWEAQDGGKRSKTEVIATDIIFVDKSTGGGSTSEGVDSMPQEDFSQEDPAEKGKGKPARSADGKDKEEVDEIDISEIPF